MLLTNWNWDDAKEVWQEEAFIEGREEGREEERKMIARNALAEGLTVEFIQKITGLGFETIETLKAEMDICN